MTFTCYEIFSEATLAELEKLIVSHCQPLSQQRLSRYYLDTLDWRLFKRGLYLQAERSESGVSLQLFDAEDEQLLSHYFCTGLPRQASQLGSGKLYELVAPILDVRSLVVHIEQRVTQRRCQVLNRQDKAQAEISLEQVELISPVAGKPRPRYLLSLGVYKGYQFDLPQARQLKLKAMQCSRIHFWLNTCQLDVLRFDQPKVKLRADMRTDVAVLALLKSFYHVLKVNTAPMLADVDTECLHDYRVAVRRTRALLSQLPGVLPQRLVEKYQEYFCYLGGVTGKLRDYDVLLMDFAHYQSLLPVAQQTALQPLKQTLQHQRQVAFLQMEHYFQSGKYQQMMSGWCDFLYRAVPEQSSQPLAMRPIAQVVSEQIWKSYQKLIRQGDKINKHSADEELHKLRKRAKKLRYLLEFFARLYEKKRVKQLLTGLKALQDNLGTFQDLHVQRNQFVLLEAEVSTQQTLAAETAFALTSLQQLLDAEANVCRKHFKSVWKVFREAEQHQLFKGLYKP